MAYLPPMNGGRINASISGNTVGAASLISSGTMILAGGNNVTLSQNGNTISFGAGAGSNVFGAGSNGAGNNMSGNQGYVSGSNLSLAFAGGNNITLSQSINAGSATITVSGPSFINGNGFSFGSSSGSITALYTGGIAVGNSQTTYSSGNVAFAGSGGISVISTAGQGLVVSAPAASSLVAGNNITLSVNASTVSVIGPAMFDAGMIGGGNGSTLGLSGTTNTVGLAFAAGNNVTLSQTITNTGGTITINAGGGVALSAPGSSYAGGTVTFGASSGAITVTGSNGSINFAVPATSSITATNLTLSTLGSTIGFSGPGPASLARWEYPTQMFSSLSTVSAGAISLQRINVPFAVTGTAMKVGGMLSVGSSAVAGVASVSMGLWMGVYTLNGSTLSQLTQSTGSANNSFTVSASNQGAAASLTLVTGMRQMTVPVNVTMSPGDYWIAAAYSSSANVNNVTPSFVLYGNPNIATNATLAPIGSSANAASAARDVLLLQGYITTNASSIVGPTSIIGSNVINTTNGAAARAAFYHVIYSATY